MIQIQSKGHVLSMTTIKQRKVFLLTGLVKSPIFLCVLAEVYLRKSSKADACRVTGMHNHVHSMSGMLASLDVTKVY